MGNFEKVMLIYKRLGLKLDAGPLQYENMIKLQKSICLLQFMGVDCGYKYGLYIKGAYCPELTIDIYKEIKRTALEKQKEKVG